MAFSFRKLTYWKRRVQARCTGRVNLHFLHIRKTGGTALKSALQGHPFTPGFALHLHPHRIALADIPSGHQVMFVTRDPITRYVSGFGSRLRQGAPAHHVPWSPEEATAFACFRDANQLALALDPAHPQHTDALHAMRNITHIECSYWDWFGDESALALRRDDILFIGQIETFEADFAALKSKIGLPADLMLPTDSKAANRERKTPSDRPVLEPRAVDLLRQWYARDFEFLAFCAAWRREQGGPVRA